MHSISQLSGVKTLALRKLAFGERGSGLQEFELGCGLKSLEVQSVALSFPSLQLGRTFYTIGLAGISL